MIICDNTRHDNTMTISIDFLLGISVHQVTAMFEYGKNGLVDGLAPDATSSDEGLTHCCCAIMGLSSSGIVNALGTTVGRSFLQLLLIGSEETNVL